MGARTKNLFNIRSESMRTQVGVEPFKSYLELEDLFTIELSMSSSFPCAPGQFFVHERRREVYSVCGFYTRRQGGNWIAHCHG